MKKALLILVTLGCFGIAVDRIVVSYRRYMPVAQPGECIELSDKTDKVNAVVINNNSENHSSLVGLMVSGFLLPKEIEYETLRELNARKIDCEKLI